MPKYMIYCGYDMGAHQFRRGPVWRRFIYQRRMSTSISILLQPLQIHVFKRRKEFELITRQLKQIALKCKRC